ncbi:uncharacterized protein TNCV_4211711 [Trichonephila clavipes]|nr:uncharacterized protein TNCV_4211711 [Trichonephila clavipes]
MGGDPLEMYVIVGGVSLHVINDNLVSLHFKYDQASRRFVEWAENEIAVVPDFHKRILFSDEAHFWLNGYVNKQNWNEANPQVYVETPLHPEKLTIWCALWAGGIIGPYFFKNDEGHNVTVNGDRYRAMITNFFIPELNNDDVQELWFQQDGATCHTARATIDLLKDTFGDGLISRFGPVNWPPRSCDLTPLDYLLWGYIKSLVDADKPQTLAIWNTTFALLLPIYGHTCWKKSSKIGRPDWTTSEPAVALEDRARAGRPCLREARAACIAVEMEAIASEAASGTSSAREAARRLGLPPSSVRNILR